MWWPNSKQDAHSGVLCTWTTSLHRTQQKDLWGCALVHEIAKLPIEGLTPEARAIRIHLKIQDPYLWSLAGHPWWQYVTGPEWPVALSSLVCVREKGTRAWTLNIQVLNTSAFCYPQSIVEIVISCFCLTVLLPAQPLPQSLTLTSYTLLKASACLHWTACHCLACTEVRISLQHPECPGSLWKLVCRKEETRASVLVKQADPGVFDTSG